MKNIFQAYEQSGPDVEEQVAQVLRIKNTRITANGSHDSYTKETSRKSKKLKRRRYRELVPGLFQIPTDKISHPERLPDRIVSR